MLGAQLSRTQPRSRRPGFWASSTISADSPSRMESGPDRVNVSRRGLAAAAISTAINSARASSSSQNNRTGQGDTRISSVLSAATNPARPVRTTSAAPEQ
ncbi:Uncharacterised protein [Mycobacteroides abscessus subsp. abscessus]|nr:Uncharacterised protein [Mycobacteroides abscessus subsp. abscessus]